MEAASLSSLSVEAREEAKEGRKRNEAYYYSDAFDGASIRVLFWCRHTGVAMLVLLGHAGVLLSVPRLSSQSVEGRERRGNG